ncbi:MAG TPA: conjugal transfer protein TraF [Arsenophonus sp.]
MDEFARQYQMSVIPISVSHQSLFTTDQKRCRTGDEDANPLLSCAFLNDPTTDSYYPLAYGFISQDDLARRLLNRVTDFAPME